MTLKDRIQYLAKKNNISINALEKDLGFGGNSIGKWDKSSPSVEKLLKVADYFGVTLDYLCNGDENTSSPESETPNISKVESSPLTEELTDNEKNLLESSRNLNSQGQDYILQTMDMVSDKYKKSADISILA